MPSMNPSLSTVPSSQPSIPPTDSHMPSFEPSGSPSISGQPSVFPTIAPSTSSQPSFEPSGSPSVYPTEYPTASPTLAPTKKCFATDDGGFRWFYSPFQCGSLGQTCALHDAVRDYYAQDCESNSTCEIGQVWGNPIGTWCVGSVVNMERLFRGDYAGLPNSITSDLSGWDTSSAEGMTEMFLGQTLFNGNFSLWDVSHVKDMSYMFQDASSFNSDISNWDVSSVTNMYEMFYGATDFDQNLCPWENAPAVLIGSGQAFRGTRKMFTDSSGEPNDGSGGFDDTAC